MSLTRIYAIILRHIFNAMHQIERTFDIFLFPIVAILLWGFVANYAGITMNGIGAFLIGGLILWIVFERVGTAVGVDFMYDIWERNIMNILASPIKMPEYILGIVLVAIFKVMLSFAMLWAIGGILFGFNIGSLGLILALLWINVVIFAVSLGIFNVSIVIRYGSNIGPLTWTIPFILQPFCAVFYPVSVLPPFLQKVSFFIPLTHVFEGMRAAIESGQIDSRYLVDAFILNIIYFVFSIAFFSFMFNLVKKKGSLAKLQ